MYRELVLDIESMIDELKQQGPKINDDLISAILERKEESFFHLAQFVTSRENWDTLSVHPWSPFCAISILAKMKDYRALLAINTAIIEYAEYMDDWLLCDAPGVLAYMGHDAVDQLVKIVGDDNINSHVRTGAETALLIIGSKNLEMMQPIIASIKQCVANEQDISIRDDILGHLLYLNNSNIRKYVDDLVDSGFATSECYELSDMEGMLNGISDFERFTIQSKDPLYFLHNNKNIIPPSMRNLTPSKRDKKWSSTSVSTEHPYEYSRFTPHQDPPKRRIGRNAPCPCGSGKKYKKCCFSRL